MTVASSMSIYGEGAYRDGEGRFVYPGLRDESDLRAGRFEPLGADGKELSPAPTSEDKPLEPTSIYAITKRDHEEMFLAVGAAYGIPTVALRYFNIYGPRQALSNPYTGVMAIFSSRIMNGNPPLIFEDGLQTRDFVHVSDIVQANLLALEKDEAVGRVYNVGTGRPTSVLRVAEALAEQLDFGEPPEVTGRFRAGDIRHCVADVSRARRELGYEPRMSLEEGMRDLLAWLRTQRPEDRVADAARELEKRGLTR
jgi:dTDP-L-rhamnose 4-epimerase